MATGVELCRQSCEYFGVCGGRTSSNQYWEQGTFTCIEINACRYRIKEVTDNAIENRYRSIFIISFE
ncbi:hypothetical protein [Chlorogloeopsis sp. ULAP02]|uniref:hypothetical protein n=1 Tax=Chlorogloeopsis sp. ULAP02 TaxID=3107926 RepID=UPI0031349F7D